MDVTHNRPISTQVLMGFLLALPELTSPRGAASEQKKSHLAVAFFAGPGNLFQRRLLAFLVAVQGDGRIFQFAIGL
ncbi:MAG: hypothetical protein Q8L91_07770, partial [Polaromonas sp.]|nr:hypothetical protein [Polaromonas sp.]